ncbi:ran GTPase-activating protein 1-like [Lycorma delicatula]|uniref:ran GTPase-activating protein 1-like n=1 Tax=Lycorma delicatula TaxID=130591 RepID=UPI003F5127A3
MSTKEMDLDKITNLLAETKLISEQGLSFAGKSLKLNTERDAKEITDSILACKNLTYLNLEGNTLGTDAAKGIAKALESHPEFKRALWKDIFTGRLKEEIPDALRFLGSGLMLAGATLTELNLSDNAFGPIGVEGLASLLKSPCCYALQELKLNNNGLGITGGKLLAKALMNCYEDSKALNKPLALKVFVAGRNRLENEGAKALSHVFETLQSLEEIIMPQNGIYHVGVTALANSLQNNKNLRVLDLNDNTVGKKGSAALAKVLPQLQSLRILNLGDCLLKTKGALSIASALSEGHANLKEVHLACNEISRTGGLAIAEVLATKRNLTTVVLDGNQFGEDGIKEIKNKIMSNSGSAAISISEDEGPEEEDDDDDEDEEEDEEEEEEQEKESEDEQQEENDNNEKPEEKQNSVVQQNYYSNVSAADFLNSPTPEKLLGLGNNRTSLILDEIKKQPDDSYLETLLTSLMKVSSLSNSNNSTIQSASLACSDALYQEMFRWASSKDQLSLVNNSLLVHLGLLKSEDKKFKVSNNVEGCKLALRQAMKRNYFPAHSSDTIKLFLERQVKKEVTTIVL